MLMVLVLAGWSLDKLVDDRLVEYFDTILDAKIKSLVALTEQDEDGIELEIYESALPEFSQTSDPDYFHMLNLKGETLFVSPSARPYMDDLPAASGYSLTNLPIDIKSPKQLNSGSYFYFDDVLPDGRSGRWVVAIYYPRIDPDDNDNDIRNEVPPMVPNLFELKETTDNWAPIMVNGVLVQPELVVTYVGVSRDALDTLMWVVDLILIITGAAIALALVLIAKVGIQKAIDPLKQLSADIGAFDEHSLDSKVTLTKPVAELEVLVEQFNSLLERLKVAFNRERQFSSNVAHELRTPIAEMRSMIEVHQRFPEDEKIAAAFSTDLLDSTERVQNLVEQLLALSKAEHKNIELGDPVALVPEFKKLLSAYTHKAQLKGLDIQLNYNCVDFLVSGAQVWPMIIVNLLDNAVDHGYGGGSIIVDLQVKGESFSMSISNPCINLQDKDIVSVFDRLWTKDASRSDANHYGLGLALVAAYARLLDLECKAYLKPSTTLEQNSVQFEILITGTCSDP